MTRIGDAAAEAARRATEAMERARKAAEEAAKRAAQAQASAPTSHRSSTSTFETARPKAPVALNARPADMGPSGEGVPRHQLAGWSAPAADAQSQSALPLAAFAATPGGPGTASKSAPTETAAEALAQPAGAATTGEVSTLPAETAAEALAQPAGDASTGEASTAPAEPPLQGPPLPADDATTAEAPPPVTGATSEPAVCDLTTGDAAEINDLAEENPAEAARRMEEMIATDPKYQDPAMVDMLLRNCAPGLSLIYQSLGQRAENGDWDDSEQTPYTRDTLEALAFITSRATPAMQQEVAESLAFWLPDGDLNQFDDILGELAAAGGPGALLYDALFGVLSATKPAAAQQLEAERIAAATQAFNDAQAGIEGLNEELAALIGAAGPGLTQAEYDAIVANFKAEHAEEYARFEAAGAALTALIADNTDVLAHPENYDPALVAQVHAAANELPELAQTQAGFEYLNSEMLKSGRGEPSLFDQLTPDAAWIQSPTAFYEGLSTALVEAAGKAMVMGRPGEAEAALDFLEAKPHLFGVDAGEAQQLRDDLEVIYKGAQRGHSPAQMEAHFRVLGNHLDEYGLSPRFKASLQVLGLIAGIADGNFPPQNGSEVLRLGLDVLGAGADVGSGLLGTASRIGTALGWGATGLGFVTTVLDGMDAYAHARAGDWDHALSSGLLAGSSLAPIALGMMGYPGVGTLVGGLLLAGSAGVGWWAGRNDQEEFQGQRLEALLAAGVPEPVARVLVDADPYRMQQLQEAGFTPAQIRVMAERYPGMLTGSLGAPIDGMVQAVLSGAFTPDEMMKMLDAASQGGADPISANILLQTFQSAPTYPATREEWLALLRQAGHDSPDPYINSDMGRAALERALAALG